MLTQLDKLISPEGTLIIVPPFTRLDMGANGPHILQACAREIGETVSILYANLAFAKQIGPELYNTIFYAEERNMICDRIFAKLAYETTILGRGADQALSGYQENITTLSSKTHNLDYATLYSVAQSAEDFLAQLTESLSQLNHTIVGCTVMFQQIASSVAIFKSLKKAKPEIVTIIGGANCSGKMAEGIATLSPDIDYVFSGECEQVFIDFLQDIHQGKHPETRIIQGSMRMDLDSLPSPNYDDFISQLEAVGMLNEPGRLHIPYQSSRGCWWGVKHHCTFYGVAEMRYRMKSPNRVMDELRELSQKYPNMQIFFNDDIMPNQYFKTLLPRLKTEIPGLRLFMDQKANLTLEKVRLLTDAGVYAILPGIEALSTPLLRLMDKGTTARQNIQLMRYGRSCFLYLVWHLLYGFPGEKADCYRGYLDLIPLISHLNPPFFNYVQLMRDSLYVPNPEKFDIQNLRPWKAYHSLYPKEYNIEDIVFYFDGDYDSVITEDPELVEKMRRLVVKWREQWSGKSVPPELSVTILDDGRYLLKDSRGFEGVPPRQIITEQQAAAVLVGFPLRSVPDSWESEWAIRSKASLELENWLVPLATAEPSLLEKFEGNLYETSPLKI